jgi:hypothetical protein
MENTGNIWNWSPINFFGSPCLSCVFNTLYDPLCISNNNNENTSWRSINSSNLLNKIMIKYGFTFESKVSNVVVFKHVMSSSGSVAGLGCAFYRPREGREKLGGRGGAELSGQP